MAWVERSCLCGRKPEVQPAATGLWVLATNAQALHMQCEGRPTLFTVRCVACCVNFDCHGWLACGLVPGVASNHQKPNLTTDLCH